MLGTSGPLPCEPAIQVVNSENDSGLSLIQILTLWVPLKLKESIFFLSMDGNLPA
jgi:hypothetical protein